MSKREGEGEQVKICRNYPKKIDFETDIILFFYLDDSVSQLNLREISLTFGKFCTLLIKTKMCKFLV